MPRKVFIAVLLIFFSVSPLLAQEKLSVKELYEKHTNSTLKEDLLLPDYVQIVDLTPVLVDKNNTPYPGFMFALKNNGSKKIEKILFKIQAIFLDMDNKRYISDSTFVYESPSSFHLEPDFTSIFMSFSLSEKRFRDYIQHALENENLLPKDLNIKGIAIFYQENGKKRFEHRFDKKKYDEITRIND
jgi:hypothetical protein